MSLLKPNHPSLRRIQVLPLRGETSFADHTARLGARSSGTHASVCSARSQLVAHVERVRHTFTVPGLSEPALTHFVTAALILWRNWTVTYSWLNVPSEVNQLLGPAV